MVAEVSGGGDGLRKEAARRMGYGCRARAAAAWCCSGSGLNPGWSWIQKYSGHNLFSFQKKMSRCGEYGLLAGGSGLRLAGGGCRIWAEMECLVVVLGRDAVVLDCAPVEGDGRGLELDYDRVVVRAQIGRRYDEVP
ncbi:hypothetical protein CASFOL_041548 [Castilleja foliolosa]|uniref:Uncharacterized protein n=1 Tax=Castilleja foliolosa TaxID=1961234 RepID=A0ABD3BC76_9LAMI